MAPIGQVYQAGTLSGNPLAMTAGIETLKVLAGPGVYERLESLGVRLEEGISMAAASHGSRVTVARIASLLTIFFNENTAKDYDSVSKADTAAFSRFFGRLLAQGIYWPPSQFEAAFISLAHSEEDIDTTIDKISEALS